jgi:hypothetical protein
MANRLSIKQCQEHHQVIQEAESTQVIRDVLQKPSDFLSRVRRFSPAVILAIIYGKRGPTWESKEVQDIYQVMQAWSRIMETGNTPPVDIFPVLKYLPNFISPWRPRALKLSNMMFTSYHGLVQEVRDRRAKGIKRDSLMDKILDDQEAPGFDKANALSEDKLAFLGGVLMEGGSDTVSPRIRQITDIIDRKHLGDIYACDDEIPPCFEEGASGSGQRSRTGPIADLRGLG